MSVIPMMFLAAMAFVVSGCALATDTPPSVDVLAVRLVGIGLTEQQLAITLSVTNPNNNEIAFLRVTASLDAFDTPMAFSINDLAVQLPPRAVTVLPLTLDTTVQDPEQQLLGVQRTGSVEYRVHGVVTFRGLDMTVPYSWAGRLDPVAGGLELASSPSRCIL